ncbi:glycoside hydrolase family 3 N-terminal domain-containing protein [Bradyrhizobium sp. NP1]|nr:glycoside hydrolase family 3 N-terminal domain-containing protein [Bradyrhizobium sp. NP1]WJR79450.1 glycoside hydrolase family 3 N-terminal domain-containing protein [Bradyrhizobium sp. NP1]
MQIWLRIRSALAGLVGLVLALAALNKYDPYLIPLRGTGNAVIVVASLLVVALLIRRGVWRRGLGGRLLLLVWILPSVAMLLATTSYELGKRRVLSAQPSRAQILGRHFVVGYTSFGEVARLAEQGLIAGVYVTRHNIAAAGGTAEGLRSEIAALQQRRRSAGLPPLVVAVDQEGGIVSHLAPPLSALPALSTLAGLPADARAQKAEELGRTHGRELASIGITQNFAPVVDLKPDAEHNPLDFNTLIGERAISDDPAVVSDVAAAYVGGLEASGVTATVKHFPGLGRLRSDTHHFTAHLDTPREVLDVSDWRPFKDLLKGTRAQLMIGHVNLAAIDPDRPASHSRRVVDGLIRKQWNYQGVIITDDLVMGAVYHNDICTAVIEAFGAGVDLLLVAYDGATQFYPIFTCALDAAEAGKLDLAALRESEARLASRTRP